MSIMTTVRQDTTTSGGFMSSVLSMTRWLLIAITVIALVFPAYTQLMLAIALVGTILYLHFAITAAQHDMKLLLQLLTELGRVGYLHSQQTVHHESEIGRLMQNAGLSPSEFKPKPFRPEGGATPQGKTDF